MTTSDSEDFESADEEIEPVFSISKSKIKRQPAERVVERDNPQCSDLSEVVRGVSSVTLPGKSEIENNNSIKLTKTDLLHMSLNEKCSTEVVETEEMHKEDTDLVVSSNENTSVEKFDTNPGDPEVLQDPTNQKLTKAHKGKRPQRTRESKSGPMKLGVRLASNKSVEDTSGEPKTTTKTSIYASEDTIDPNEEKNKPESDSYASLLDKMMSGMSSNPVASEDQSKRREVEQQTPQSTGWGFGKGLMGTGGWGGVGVWGSTLLNTASLSVSTLGSHVTQGISTVLETVEAGIGAPTPEELARKMKEENGSNQQSEHLESLGKERNLEGKDPAVSSGELDMEAWGDWNEDGGGDGTKGGTGLLSLVSGVTQVTGKVLSTGLDTLEVIGKKTMEVLQEGDPGLKKKRALLLGDGDTVVLSQVLREAKEKAEAAAKLAEEKEAERKAHFETLFDDYQGLVHLEALEMLSRQSDLRLKSILLKESGPALRGLQIRLAAVQEMCEIPDCDEDEEDVPTLSEIIPEALKSIGVEISAEKLIQGCKDSYGHLEVMRAEVEEDGVSKVTPRIIHREAITALATLSAHSIEVFHKVTELLLVKEGKSRDVKEEAKAMVWITSALTSEVNKIATEFSDFLSSKLNDESLSTADKDKIESFITSVFLEASNSSTYIQDAFQLMVPVLQVGAVA